MKKYLIAGLLVAGFVTPALAARVLRGAGQLEPQMFGRVEEAGRNEADHARHRWLQDEVGGAQCPEGHDRVQGLSFGLTPGMRTPSR